MARFSQTAGHIKLEDEDIIAVMGVKFMVESVELSLNVGAPHVLVIARSRHAEDCNVFNFSEVEAVKLDGKWVNMKGEAVTV